MAKGRFLSNLIRSLVLFVILFKKYLYQERSVSSFLLFLFTCACIGVNFSLWRVFFFFLQESFKPCVRFIKDSLNSCIIHLSTVGGAWDLSKVKLENLLHYPINQTVSYACCRTQEAKEGA